MDEGVPVPVPSTKSTRYGRLGPLRQCAMTHRQLLGMRSDKLANRKTQSRHQEGRLQHHDRQAKHGYTRRAHHNQLARSRQPAQTNQGPNQRGERNELVNPPGKRVAHIDQHIHKAVAVSHVLGFIYDRGQRVEAYQQKQHPQRRQKY